MVFSLKARMEEQVRHQDETFLFSISLPCGHSTNWLQKDGEVFEIGRAASKIFGTYKKKVLEEKGIRVNLAVEMNATIFWGEASKKDLVSIIKELANNSFENEKFNQAKKQAINDLKHNYRNDEYKALFKSYELIFYNQQFNFQEFILSHRKLKVESLKFIQNNIVTEENVYIFIDGEFEKEAVEGILPRTIENQSMIVFPTINKRFNFDYRVNLRGHLNDEYLIVKFNSSILDTISKEKEFLILTFWGQRCFGRNYSVFNHFSNKAICGIRKKGLPMDIERSMITENVFDEIKTIIISSFERLANTNDGKLAILKGKLRMDRLDWNKLQQELEKINLQDVLVYLEKCTIQYGQITFSGELNNYGR
ncbi:hypothetical protein [Listeria seeligeri]|uniref:hypothetical protein n=1 Tax=Listeria seeligeri TaxID=1640 RepID=UPI0016251933|nr:hypothetical protein [Listeria seeligeri]MBC1886324.1 hypothetical protein [Listeria seeligeri]